MIDKKTLIKSILNKKEIVDYTYGILFLVISSFFLFFAIRPALSIAFSLQRESVDLKKLNVIYEENVLKIVEIQSNIERIRDNLYILDEALPQSPNADSFIQDINSAARLSNFSLNHFEVVKIPLKEIKPSASKKTLLIKIDGSGEFVVIDQFIKELLLQKRIKTIKTISIGQAQKQSTSSASLNVIIEMEGHYL